MLLDLLVFFEELVEQHGVHRIVAHGINLAVFVAYHQVRVHLGHFLSHKAKLRDAFCVVFIVKRHRFKCQDSFTGLIHGSDVFLEPLRGSGRAEVAIHVDRDCRCTGEVSGSFSKDAGDERGRLHCWDADADRAGLAGNIGGSAAVIV